MANPVYLDEGFARRLAALLPFLEKLARTGNSVPQRQMPSASGFLEIGVAELQENLTAGGNATAKALRQNASTAAFSLSEAADAEFEVYDSLNFLSNGTPPEFLADGCIVVYWRNPMTGFRNVIGSPCCPSTE